MSYSMYTRCKNCHRAYGAHFENDCYSDGRGKGFVPVESMKKSEAEKLKDGWVAWLKHYGADKFYDTFMRNAQNAEGTCVNCGEKIYLDIAEGGGVPDWRTHDGDYGCFESPDTIPDEGCGGHEPLKD